MEVEEITRLSMAFLRKNYNYIWLKAMLGKGKTMVDQTDGTLVTGSSHALNGIEEGAWKNGLNCSMHSQDLYYDFLCAKEVIKRPGRFKRCFIIFGYYIAYQDLSLSKGMRDYMVSPVYYPVFHDAHNWDKPVASDLWKDFGEVSAEVRIVCEQAAQQLIYRESTYYSKLKWRKPFFDFNGQLWWELSEEERDEYGKQRAQGHNSVLKYQNSFYENQTILKDYIHFLHLNHTMPIVIIPPFTSVYIRYTAEELKEAVTEMLKKLNEDVHFIDFNQFELFDDFDFIDTDHLNESGARKMSRILVQEFGG